MDNGIKISFSLYTGVPFMQWISTLLVRQLTSKLSEEKLGKEHLDFNMK
jgi:hypothetical protein